MKTFKTFRNVNQVINEVQGIAFDVAQVSGSHLPISDSKIDAELLRKSTAEQRAAGITIYVREHGTQYANASDVAEVRKAWGRLVVRTIEITKERGGLWVVALDCLTRYDNNGEAIPQTADQIKADAKQAEDVATMATREAVLTRKPSHIKAAALAQAEAYRLLREATAAELAEVMAHNEAETTTEDENTTTEDNTPQGGKEAPEREELPTVENSPASDKIRKACHEVATRTAHAAKKAGALLALGLVLCSALFLLGLAAVLMGGTFDALELTGAPRVLLACVLLFTVIIDLIAWAEINAMICLNRLHIFDNVGGFNRDLCQYLRPFSVIGLFIHTFREA